MRRIACIAVLLVALAACSKATTTSSSGGGDASATPAASPPAATSPASSPVSSSGGGIQYYECASLLSDQEVQQATGLSDAALFSQEHGEAVKGQTYCQFFAQQGAISIAVSVLTGPSYTQVFEPLAQAGASLPDVAGVGDSAKWSDQGAMLGIRVGSTGVTIFFTNIGGGSLGISDPQGAAVAMGKLVVSRL